MADDAYTRFVRSVCESSGNLSLGKAACGLYESMARNGWQGISLTIPDSMRQNCVCDYKGLFGTVPTGSSKGGPDMVGNYDYSPVGGRCSRDIADETRKDKGKAPKFKKAKTPMSPFVKKLIDRAKEHLPNPLQYCGIPGGAQPMVRGMSTNAFYPNTYTQGASTVTSGGSGGQGS